MAHRPNIILVLLLMKVMIIRKLPNTLMKFQEKKKYKEKLSYYQADMNFKLGNFQKAIDLGDKAMAKSSAIEKSVE
jgi:hypothetical protein